MDPDTAIGGPHGRFPSTQLSLLAAAAAGLPNEALERVIALYWKPVYRFIRYAAAHRQKRGGEVEFEPVEEQAAVTESPEQAFEREWQRELFTLALEDLRAHCAAAGKHLHWAIFEAYDLAEVERPPCAPSPPRRCAPIPPHAIRMRRRCWRISSAFRKGWPWRRGQSLCGIACAASHSATPCCSGCWQPSVNLRFRNLVDTR